MKLPVLSSDPSKAPWYADGLRFTCTQCGNCCTGSPGVVWITEAEIGRLAAHLNLTARQVVNKFCRRVGDRMSLKERKTPAGEYDCIFLKEIEPENGSGPSKASLGTTDAAPRKGCSIYEARPLQCRTWPFWKSNLDSLEAWAHSRQRCNGMDAGDRRYTLEQIEEILRAKG